MTLLTPPVFCDHCSCFALAFYDEEILCTQCLLERFREGGSLESIQPLVLVGVETERSSVTSPGA